MSRLISALIVLVLLAFGLPALFQTIESLIIPIIIFTFFTGLGVFLFQRRRRW